MDPALSTAVIVTAHTVITAATGAYLLVAAAIAAVGYGGLLAEHHTDPVGYRAAENALYQHVTLGLPTAVAVLAGGWPLWLWRAATGRTPIPGTSEPHRSTP